MTSWIGIGGTALLALLGLVSSGFWGMVMMVALVVLATVVYAVAFRRTTWLRLPRKRSVAGIGVGVTLAILIGSTAAFGAAHPEAVVAVPTSSAKPHAAASDSSPKPKPRALLAPSKRTPNPTATPTPTPTPVVVTQNVTETVAIPFASQTVQDASIAKGSSTVTTAGRDGVETKVWRITMTDGVQTGKTLVRQSVTSPPTSQVTSIGTYVAPAPPAPAPASGCSNGSYVNSAGNTICRPTDSPGQPAGATAQCRDGEYSFSQSRRGTCSGHGGVATWL